MARPNLLIVGGGDRGTTYAKFCLDQPNLARVSAVADPDMGARDRLARAHQIPANHCFADWRDALEAPRVADAVVIATQDRDHAEPAVAFAEAGWPILLEKPMAPTVSECRTIVESVRRAGVLFAVAHVLRYTPYTQRLVKLIEQGAIGDVVSVQRLEPVGYWHFAHSYVRGNWRKESESSSVLLAKCCHDLDWIRYIVGAECLEVASFASRFEFRAERRPEGAADRCVDCNVESRCPYSAVRLYQGRARANEYGWPVSVVTPEPTEAAVEHALTAGPYGRCVYACDNDVPDHQVVNLKMAGERCAAFTMSAFTPFAGRRTTVFGTRGWLVGDGESLELHNFLTNTHRRFEPQATQGYHAGGDHALMRAFVTAVASDSGDSLLSGPDETLETHLTVFAAELARHENRVVRVSELTKPSGGDL